MLICFFDIWKACFLVCFIYLFFILFFFMNENKINYIVMFKGNNNNTITLSSIMCPTLEPIVSCALRDWVDATSLVRCQIQMREHNKNKTKQDPLLCLWVWLYIELLLERRSLCEVVRGVGFILAGCCE